WLLGTPAWVAVLAGAVTGLHEYVRARAVAAGMTGLGVTTLAEHRTRAGIAALGLALAGAAGFATRELTVGTATLAGTAWLLFGQGGLGIQRATDIRVVGGEPLERGPPGGRELRVLRLAPGGGEQFEVDHAARGDQAGDDQRIESGGHLGAPVPCDRARIGQE